VTASLSQPRQRTHFIVGERPEALMWQYVDGDGIPIVLDPGADIRVRFSRRGSAAYEGLGTLEDSANGWVRYDWIGHEIDRPGVLSVNFWTDSGGMLLASETIAIRCFTSNGGPPPDLVPPTVIDPGAGSDLSPAFYPIIRTNNDTMVPEDFTLAKAGVPWNVDSAIAQVRSGPSSGDPLLLDMNVSIVADVVTVGDGDLLDFGPGTFFWDLEVTDVDGSLTVLWGTFILRPDISE